MIDGTTAAAYCDERGHTGAFFDRDTGVAKCGDVGADVPGTGGEWCQNWIDGDGNCNRNGVVDTVASAADGIDFVKCYQQVACGVATTVTIVVGGSIAGSVCLLSGLTGPGLIVVCGGVTALTGAATAVVVEATLYKDEADLLCAALAGTVGGLVSGPASAIVGGVSKPVSNGVVKTLTRGAACG